MKNRNFLLATFTVLAMISATPLAAQPQDGAAQAGRDRQALRAEARAAGGQAMREALANGVKPREALRIARAKAKEIRMQSRQAH